MSAYSLVDTICNVSLAMAPISTPALDCKRRLQRTVESARRRHRLQHCRVRPQLARAANATQPPSTEALSSGSTSVALVDCCSLILDTLLLGPVNRLRSIRGARGR